MIPRISLRLLNFQKQSKQFFSTSTDIQQRSQEFAQRYQTLKIDEIANMEYKKFPDHLSHYNTESPDYIKSFRDDFRANNITASYNYYIDRLKSDLQMQQRVHEILRNMDRPYLNGRAGSTRNVRGGLKNYQQPANGVQQGMAGEDIASALFNNKNKNEDRFLNQSIYYPKFAKMTHFDIEWPKELESRPVTNHFHPDKGYKYDVFVPVEERYPYQADRLGHPEILGTPHERLCRLEGEIYHPNWLDQPFVKIPSQNPDENLNFEEGEVLYENTKLVEWAKFWNYSIIFGFAWGALFVPYQLLLKTHMPLEYAFDNLFLPYTTRSFYYWDINQLHIPILAISVMYATHIAMRFLNFSWSDYVVKAQYSKDKELLFVTRISAWNSTREEVYEMAHLDSLPPSVRSGVQHMSAQDDDGLFDVTCLNSQRNLLFYQEGKYWNPDLKNPFYDKVTQLWTKDYAGLNREEDLLDQQSEEIQMNMENLELLEHK